ncbi:MAG: nucleotidyl transferase AbiEii/AbiGii toxin family protein [Acidimicrobiia bacterium]
MVRRQAERAGRRWCWSNSALVSVSQLESALRRLVGDLVAEKVEFALVGGLAISIRAEPRLTRDADFAVSVRDDSMAEEIVRNLAARGYRPDLVQEHERGRLATVRLANPESPIFSDLLFASSGIEPEVVAAAESLEVLPRFEVPVATTGHLIALKLLARDDRVRPADADDLRALAAIAVGADWEVARSAVGLIRERGYERGRDLETALSELQATRSP